MLKSIKMFLSAYAVALPISALIFFLIVNGATYFLDQIINVMVITIVAGFALYIGLSCGFYVEDVLIRARKISGQRS